MPDDTEAAALRAQLEAIVKEAEAVEAQAAATHHRVQIACLLLEEESKATTMEQTTTAARQHMPSSFSSSSSSATASQLVPTTSLTYEDTIVAGLHLQATVVLNIRQLVNIVLDSCSTGSATPSRWIFTRWSGNAVA
jgi:G3E family GTPase